MRKNHSETRKDLTNLLINHYASGNRELNGVFLKNWIFDFLAVEYE